jgi:hypothetical protein
MTTSRDPADFNRDAHGGSGPAPAVRAAQLVDAQRDYLRRAAEKAGGGRQLALIEAAHAEPTLRQLYPYTSHWGF